MYKFGLKLWSTNDFYVEEAVRLYKEGLYSYIELYVVPNSYDDYSGFWINLKIPFVIHAPHFKDGVNLAKSENFCQNMDLAKEAIKWADKLDSKIIIFHPGISGDEQETIRQLNEIKDKRIVIENKPYYTISGDMVCNGHSPKQIKNILQKTELGFCLDVGHAICFANAQKIAPTEIIKVFAKLKPKIFHLSDGDFGGSIDQHLNIGFGSYNIDEILKLIPLGSFITIETNKKSKSDLIDFEEDIKKLNEILLKKVSFRDADIKDSELLLEWRNDSLTRNNSVNSNVVSLEEHKKWLSNSLNNQNRKIFMAQVGDLLIGTVRFDKEDVSGDWELSWTVAPCMRGKGLGKLMVRSSTRLLNANLKARVKNGNYSSSNIAEFAGFKFVEKYEDMLLFRLER